MALTKLNYTGQGTVPSAKMPAGSVLQVKSQQMTNGQNLTTSYATMLESNIAITPNFTSSKILIEFGYHLYINTASSGVWRGASVRLMNVTANTVLLPGNGVYGDSLIFDGSNERLMTYSNGSFIHSPSTTSSITYGLEVLKNSDAGTVQTNSSFGRKGYITLTEIKV